MFQEARFDKRIRHLDFIHQSFSIRDGKKPEKSWSETLIEKGVYHGRLEMLTLLMKERFGEVDPALTNLMKKAHEEGGIFEFWAVNLAKTDCFEDVFGAPIEKVRMIPVYRDESSVFELNLDALYPQFTAEERTNYVKDHPDSHQYELAMAKYLIKKGKQHVQQGILLQMLVERFGKIKLAFEEKTWYADSEQLCHWAVKVLTANTVEEVFQAS